MNPSLFFNILTFDWPAEPVTFYFSDTDKEKCRKLYFTLFPKEINSIYPDIVNNSTNNIYTTFTGERKDFEPLTINFQTENPDLIKRYYNRQINYYFRVVKSMIVKVGFIKENQVWLKAYGTYNESFDLYDKYSLKVQLATVSKFPELVLTYDGQAKVFKKSVVQLINTVSPSSFNWVLHKNQLLKWTKCQDYEDIDQKDCYPVLNRKLAVEIGLAPIAPPRDNRYIKYLNFIQNFYKKFLNNASFREIIPLHSEGFLNVMPTRIDQTSEESNQLLFLNNQQDSTPKYALKRLKPFKKSPYPNIHLFYIVHADDLERAKLINERFNKGFGFFKGMHDYVGLLFHTEKNFSILFKDKENPLPEIESELSKRIFNPDVKYIAIYVTPIDKYDQDKRKREIYYQLKEVLLKRKITSQVIDPNKMNDQGENWTYSLPNIAVAMLAKLDGIPWQLNTPIKKELIVGVGAFKHIDQGVQYIGSAFSFSNNGKFNRFEYFLRDEVDILAGSIAHAVKQYATVNADPDRLIIHFYKTMSERDLEPIQKALEDLGLPIPVIIITINKTESEDIVAFDGSWSELMPPSGTFIGIGSDKYLLFNNTRYKDIVHSKADGYPFPIKLKLQCTNPTLLKDMKAIKELIDQVYQFSRMYWKSIRQQNLPVTIKYPEMVAQIAPHFIGDDIPPYGKDNLWFL